VQPGLSNEDFKKLRDQSEQRLAEFIALELQLGFTFAEAPSSEQAKKEARKALATIYHFLDRITNPNLRSDIANRCLDLEKAISVL
jgi:hypothetical protein